MVETLDFEEIVGWEVSVFKINFLDYSSIGSEKEN